MVLFSVFSMFENDCIWDFCVIKCKYFKAVTSPATLCRISVLFHTNGITPYETVCKTT